MECRRKTGWLTWLRTVMHGCFLSPSLLVPNLVSKAGRKHLFNLINDLPTISEVETGATKKQANEKSYISNHSGSKSKLSLKANKSTKVQAKDEDDGDEPDKTFCGACGKYYTLDEFWICCDICERWFHGRCVKITPARAEHMKQYTCPICINKRAGP